MMASYQPVKAFHAAPPTLLLGMASGSQGRVQVWAAGPGRLRLEVLTRCTLGGLSLSLFWSILGGALGVMPVLFPCLSMGLYILCAAASLCNPGYVTTDDTGLAIAGWDGSCAFHWNDVQSLYRRDSVLGYSLVLAAPGRIEISLAGYSERMQLELFRLIVREANLYPVPPARYVYRRQPS